MNLSIDRLLKSGDSGAPRRIRTPDPLIRSQVLYPAELSVRRWGFSPGGTSLQEPIENRAMVGDVAEGRHVMAVLKTPSIHTE